MTKAWIAAWGIVACAWGQTDAALIARVKKRMADNASSLPNYTCLETIERTVRKNSKPKHTLRDRIHIEVAFIDGREMFSWPGAHEFEPNLLEQIPQVGASGTGAFGGWTRSLFGPKGPDMTHAGACETGEHRGERYTFQVPVESSNYLFRYEGQEAVLPYSGSICVDRETPDVLELEVEIGQLPAQIASISESLHYGRVRVGATEFLLPLDDELSIAHHDADESRNRIEFTGCREYGSQSTISFGDEGDAETSEEGKAKPEEVQLPGGVKLDVRLEAPITPDSAVGDAITGRLNRPVEAAGILIPKGAVVTGRIRGLEQYTEPDRYYLVTLEFTSASVAGRRAAFRSWLTGPVPIRTAEPTRTAQGGSRTAYRESTGWEIVDPESGTGTFLVRGGSLKLGRGEHMIFETRSGEP